MRGGGATADLGEALRAAAAALLAAAACAPAGPPEIGPSPPRLTIPEARGPLELYVAYPDAGDGIAVSDSNFIFGSTGTGAAELTIDGRPVEVNPNGSFLAWLPVPERAAGDTARYRLVARADGEADTVVHPVLLPPEAYRGEGRVWLDTASAGALGERWSLPGEEVELWVRAAPGLEAWVAVEPGPAARGDPASGAAAEAPAAAASSPPPWRMSLEEAEPGRYRLRTPAWRLAAAARAGRRGGGPGPAPATGDSAESGRPGRPAPGGGAGADTVGRTPPRAPGRRKGRRGAGKWWRSPGRGALRPGGAGDTLELRFGVTDGRDTARASGRMAYRLLDPGKPPLVALREAPDSVHGRSGSLVGRPAPHASYAWVFPDRSRALADRREGDRVRLRLSEDQEAWVAAEDVVELPGATADGTSLRGAVGTVTLSATSRGVRVEIPVRRRVPADVRRPDPSTVAVTLHGGLGATERMLYGTGPGVAAAALTWEQLPGPRYRLRVEMEDGVWGWRVRWRPPGVEDDGDPRDASPAGSAGPGEAAVPDAAWDTPGGTLVLEVRRPPAVDEENPLRGIRVAVDAGHPPVGAEGPTGLTEADANLAVARELEVLLREAGAEPVMVRDDSSPVGLYERRRRARAAEADLLVSIHNDALPDGLRPFDRAGTSVYYFHPQALGLARAVHQHLLARMGLRDLGVRWGNLALPREPWMPSVLTEGAFMMIPAHEAALRTDAFQRAYARGVLEGIRELLEARSVAARETSSHDRRNPKR